MQTAITKTTDNAVTTSQAGQLDAIKAMVLDSLQSANTRRAYDRALTDFLQWMVENQTGFTRPTVNAYATHLRASGVPDSSVNQRLSAIRKFAEESAANGLLDYTVAQAVKGVRGRTARGTRSGNWLTQGQAQAMLDAPDTSTLQGLRDRAIIAVALGCGLRREEIASLTFDHIQQREGRWAIVDLQGKRMKLRTVPMPVWAKYAIDAWALAAGLTEGRIFRPIRKGDHLDRDAQGVTAQAVYSAIARHAPAGIAPHDLRRTFAKLALKGGASLEQISVNLGHDSLTTTQKYLGVNLDFQNAPADVIPLTI